MIRTRSLPRRIAGSALRIWLATALLAVCAQRVLVFPAWMVHRHEGDGVRWPGFERVAVTTADGETLAGLWRRPSPGAPVMVTFHGNASTPQFHAARFGAPPWTSHGWGVLAVAYRGYPGSTGSPSERGVLADGDAAVAFVRRHTQGAGIVFHGHSLGTGVAVAMAARHESQGLYLEAPYSSILDVARHRAPFLPTSLLADTFRSDLRIGKVRSPIIAVHGLEDPVIPAKIGTRLFAGMPIGTLRTVPGDHFSIFGTRDPEAEPLFRKARQVAPGS